MKKIAFLLLTLCFFSCNKPDDSAYNDSCASYVAGDLGVFIKPSASLEDAFSLFNQHNFQIRQLVGFTYISPYPADSLASLTTYLNSKSYINTHRFSAHPSVSTTGRLTMETYFFDMTIANQADWLQTVQDLQLTYVPGETQGALIKVPVGEEKHWRDTLRENSIVQSTELSCYGHLDSPW